MSTPKPSSKSSPRPARQRSDACAAGARQAILTAVLSSVSAAVMAYGAHAASLGVVGAVRDAAWLVVAPHLRALRHWAPGNPGTGLPPGNAEDLVRARLERHAHAVGICLCVAAMVATRSTVLIPVIAVQVALAVW